MAMRWKSAITVAVLSLAFPTTSSAAGLGGPTEQLRGAVDRVLKLVVDPAARRESPHARRAALRRIADDIFDWGETAKRALGTHWRERTQAERDEFVRLFAGLLERSYMAKVELYDGERIGYAGETVEGDQAVVRTKLVNKHGSEMSVSYRMRRAAEAERWKVYDVEIEGVSLVANYRTQFASVLRRATYGELVRALRAKSTEPEVEAAMASPRAR
jgi:phospholipid transport system substrate-binding protein